MLTSSHFKVTGDFNDLASWFAIAGFFWDYRQSKTSLFFAVQASLTRDYEPMKAVFNAVLNKTERSF
jgi:hypothetical protein